MLMLELLAYAANPEAVIAAVQSGADSIYIKFGGFRPAAFSKISFEKALRYCRVRGCRVYMEFDSLVSNREIPSFAALIQEGAQQGVSAVIVQDWGTVPIVSAVLPEMDIFAGERLGLHNIAGFKKAKELGIKRIFLPQQMNSGEIEILSKNIDMDFSVMVFGESCVARAGLCYLPAFAENLSCNRGDCNRYCRREFSFGHRMEDHPMRMNDISLLRHIPKFMEMGIKSLHIGKSVIVPEQTALLCSVMRRNIDNASVPSPPEISDIEFAFSGRKFQDEYFTAERREEELMGEYTEADKALENLLSEVRQEYSKSERRRVAVNIYAVLEKNKKFRVAAEDHDGNRVVFLGPKSMGAKTRAINERYLETELYKTGETPYYADKVMAYAEEGLTLPENTVQEARTQIISKLSRRRAKVPEVKIGKMPGEPESKAEILETKTIVEVREREQLTRELAELKPDYIYLPLKYAHETELLRPFKEHGAIAVAVVPPIVHDFELKEIVEAIKRTRDSGVDEAIVSNFGHIELCTFLNMNVRGDWGLNLFNSYALKLASEQGLISATASTELRLDQISRLHKPLDVEIIIYGRMPTMISELWIARAPNGKIDPAMRANMSDNWGSVYPVDGEYGGRNLVSGDKKVYIADRADEFKRMGIWGARIRFTGEGPRECVETVKACMGLSGYRPNGLSRGLYLRGVR